MHVNMDTKARYSFKVRSYECGPDGLATLASVCNFLQEAAGKNAAELGFSKSNFAAEGSNHSWVLTRLRVKMSRYPRWDDTVEVETYPRSGRRITAHRDFLIIVGGETIGVATSEWMIIDLSTRKIAPVPEFVYRLVNDEQLPVIEGEPFSKLRWSCTETAGEMRLRARRGDIDLNGHVNNVHYIEWLIETLPNDALAVTDLEIAFKSETLAGEEVSAASVEVEPRVWAAHIAALDGSEHVVARIVAKDVPQLC